MANKEDEAFAKLQAANRIIHAEQLLAGIRKYLVSARYAAVHNDRWDLYNDYTEALQIIYMANLPANIKPEDY